MDTATIIVYCLALLAAFFIFYTKFQLKNKKRKEPQSPPALPLVGHLHLLKEPFHRTFESLSRRYGPVFSLRLGLRRFLIISSPEAAEQCFSKNDVVFANRPKLAIGQVLGYDYTVLVWASYGDLWRNVRRVMTLEAFSSHRLQLNSRIRVEEVRFIAREILLGSGSGKVDLTDAFTVITRNLVMRMVTGKRWKSGAHDDLLALSKLLNMCDFFPFLRWLGFGLLIEKDMKRVWLKRDRFLQSLLDEAREENKTTSSSMVDELLELQKSEPEYYTDNILKGILLLMLTAGTDTSTRTMEWAMSLLLDHPSSFQKARSEIDNHVGTTRLVDDSDLSNLTFIRCVINETLRLFPATPLLIPHCSSADTTVAGYHVAKGTTLLVNAWALHRDPKVWEDPLAFKPERFKDVDSQGLGFRFIPFGVGRRACPGSNLAMRMITLALATWIQCFDWEDVEGGVVATEDFGGGISMSKSQPLRAICKPRASMVNVLSQL